MRRVALVAVGMAGLGGLGAEVWVVRDGVSLGTASLDLAAGWALLAAAAGAPSLARSCRVLTALAGALWFVGTLEVVGGSVAHAAALWGSLYSGPLVGALLAAPSARPRHSVDNVLVTWTWLRAIVPPLAASNVVTLLTGAALVARGASSASSAGGRLLARSAAGGFGAVLGLGAMLRLAGTGSGFVSPLLSLVVIGCAGAILIVAGRPLSPAAVTSLVVDLGGLHDAGSLERRLGEALGDRSLRLSYRLRPGGEWLDAVGRSAPAPAMDAERKALVVEGPDGVAAGLLYDSDALDDPALRDAVLGAVRLAVQRLRRAADAAEGAEELTASRRRLQTAAAEEQSRFSAEVRKGPEAELVRAAKMLDVAVAAAPPELAMLLAGAVQELSEARADLSTAARGAGTQLVAAGGLEPALAALAGRVGAAADLQLEASMLAPAVAAAAWLCVSEAVANSRKHAPGSRIAIGARITADRLVVEVADDGPGGAVVSGSGLAGLRARATEVGGAIAIESAPGAGTRITLELPLSA